MAVLMRIIDITKQMLVSFPADFSPSAFTFPDGGTEGEKLAGNETRQMQGIVGRA